MTPDLTERLERLRDRIVGDDLLSEDECESIPEAIETLAVPERLREALRMIAAGHPDGDPWSEEGAQEIARAALSPDQGTRAGTSEPPKSADTCPSCGSDDPNTRLVAPRGGDEGSTRYCTDPFHGCTCEPTGECLHSMSGPTCFIPGCPPCQHPELDTDPRCSVHGEGAWRA